MKFVIILSAIVAGVTSAGPQATVKVSQEKMLRAEQYSIPCAQKYNVDPALFLKTSDGTLPRDEATNKYLYCFTLNGGFIKEDGHMVVDRIAGLLEDHPLIEEFKEALHKCNLITKEDPIATVVEMNICLTERAPVRFLF